MRLRWIGVRKVLAALEHRRVMLSLLSFRETKEVAYGEVFWNLVNALAGAPMKLSPMDKCPQGLRLDARP